MSDPTPSPTPAPIPAPAAPDWPSVFAGLAKLCGWLKAPVGYVAQSVGPAMIVLAAIYVYAQHTDLKPPKPVPPVPPPLISLPAEVHAQPGRQAVITATTKGTVVEWWALQPETDVSYHAGSHKASVSAPIKGRYPVLAWTAIDGKPTPPAVCWLVVGDAPPPGPGPGPGPIPPGPAPIQVGKLRVMVVLDKNAVANLPKGQQDIINLPKDLRDYLNSHCGVGDDGKSPEFRFFDFQQDVSGSSAAWKAGFAKAAGKPLPYAIVANETATWEGVLPATKEDFLTTLRKYGGP